MSNGTTTLVAAKGAGLEGGRHKGSRRTCDGARREWMHGWVVGARYKDGHFGVLILWEDLRKQLSCLIVQDSPSKISVF